MKNRFKKFMFSTAECKLTFFVNKSILIQCICRCSVFKLNINMVNALFSRELLGFTCSELTNKLVQVNPDNSLEECVNL